MDIGFGLKVQLLASFNERVLVVGQLAGLRQSAGWFRPSDIDKLLEELRVHGGNVSRALSLLDAQKLVLRSELRKAWSLTPTGNERAVELVGELDADRVSAQLAGLPGAMLGQELHTVIPATLAPQRWMPAIERMLRVHPFETNVFLMARFPSGDNDPTKAVIDTARAVLAKYGYTLHVASDLTLDQDLWSNVAAHLWACQYGLGLFEDFSGDGLNYNVMLEVGAMVSLGRRCMLLRDDSAPVMPTDLVGQIYTPVSFAELEGVEAAIESWVEGGLSLD